MFRKESSLKTAWSQKNKEKGFKIAKISSAARCLSEIDKPYSVWPMAGGRRHNPRAAAVKCCRCKVLVAAENANLQLRTWVMSQGESDITEWIAQPRRLSSFRNVPGTLSLDITYVLFFFKSLYWKQQTVHGVKIELLRSPHTHTHTENHTHIHTHARACKRPIDL